MGRIVDPRLSRHRSQFLRNAIGEEAAGSQVRAKSRPMHRETKQSSSRRHYLASCVALFSTRRILSFLVALGSPTCADHVALGQCHLPLSRSLPGPPRDHRASLFVARRCCGHSARPRRALLLKDGLKEGGREGERRKRRGSRG